MPSLPTASYALTTVERLKARLKITTSGFDTTLGELIAAATDYIEKSCGHRRFAQTSYVNQIYDGYNVDGTFKRVLLLRNGPLTSTSSFQYRTGTRTNPVWVDFQADTYEPDYRLSLIRVGLPPGWQNIRVSYIAGYLVNFNAEFDNTQHTLPYDISDLCERIASRIFKKRESEGKDSESFNSSSVKWASVVDDFDKGIIANYSIVPLL